MTARRPTSAARLRQRAWRSWLLVFLAAAGVNGAIGVVRDRPSERWSAIARVPLDCGRTQSGIITLDEWHELPPESRPLWTRVSVGVHVEYDRTGWWDFPPVVERATAWLHCVPARPAADAAFRNRHGATIQRVLRGLIGDTGTRFSHPRVIALAEDFGPVDAAFTRPYWPGIAWLAGLVLPAVVALLLSVGWAVRSTQRARRAATDGPLCARCLYPLDVPDSAVCPECGTPVNWEYRLLR